MEIVNHLLQYFKVIFEGFATTIRVVDDDTGTAQTDQGEPHGHAVVFVGIYQGSPEGSGIDCDGAIRGFAADPQLIQFCNNSV